MRIIFIPGFGEDEFIFSRIAPLFDGDKLLLNSWKLLGNEPRDNFNALKFAEEFISKYHITGRDILIGHSMGGWIAYHVKHLINCPIIHVASMTNTDRIIPPVFNHPVAYWLIKKDLVFNSFTQWLSATIVYNNRNSKGIFLYIVDLLKKGNKENVINQLKVVLNPVNEVITEQPDLRIHSKGDTILKPPREPYYEVTGDHFTLYTHPKEVYLPIADFLRKCNF